MLNDSLPLPLEPAVAPSTVQLYHGDCLEVMPTLEPKSVAMVFADLPYGTKAHRPKACSAALRDRQ